MVQGFGLDSHKKSWAEESTRVGGNLGPGQRELVPKKRSLYPDPLPLPGKQTLGGVRGLGGPPVHPHVCGAYIISAPPLQGLVEQVLALREEN